MKIWPRLASFGSRRLRRLFVVVLVVAGIMFTFANPARTWLDQQEEIAAARKSTTKLDKESRDLEARVALLGTDAEVERIAREQYGLVRPGEEAFGILPVPEAAPPSATPPPPKARRWWQRAWDTAAFWG